MVEIDKKLQGVSGIYCIENTKTRKKYVGSSKDVYYRLHRHKSDLLKNRHANQHIQNSWNKYKSDCFRFYLLEKCEIDKLFEVEQTYIDSGLYVYNKHTDAKVGILNSHSKNKISVTLKNGYKSGRIKPTRTRSIEVYDLKDNHIYTFNTLMECATSLNIHVCSIHRVLNEKHKQCKGYKFKYTTASLKKLGELLGSLVEDNQQPS